MNENIKSKKKAARKQHLMAMVSMMLVVAVTLGVATYAWFSFVSNPEVRNMDMYVKAAENIFLSPYEDMDQEGNF